jgi:hypothetical protein
VTPAATGRPTWCRTRPASSAPWPGTAAPRFAADALVINGNCRTLLGDIDGAAGVDICWYCAGSAYDVIWFG